MGPGNSSRIQIAQDHMEQVQMEFQKMQKVTRIAPVTVQSVMFVCEEENFPLANVP